MSRSITELGGYWPDNVQSIETFNSSFQYDISKEYNGLDFRMFQHQCFTWLATANEEDPSIGATDTRSFQMTMPDENGDEKLVKITPQSPARQTVINREMSGIIWRQDWAALGLPDLARLEEEDGMSFMRLEALETPDDVKDEVMGVVGDFTIVRFDENAKTITFEGQPYYRKRMTTTVGADGVPDYDIGEHMGMARYLRDQLNSDAQLSMDAFKLKTYDYGIMEANGVRYKYDSIIDSPETDFRIGPYPTDDPANGVEKYTVFPIYPSEHTVRFEQFPEGVLEGDTMTLLRHLPTVTTMAATNGVFGQEGGFWDIKWRFARHKRQFSSGFLFPCQRETNARGYLQRLKEAEIDIKEVPAATTPFMNTHRPAGGTDAPNYGMYNYAALNGLTPVHDELEWTENNKQQHQILIGFDSPDYIDPYKWHETRVVMWDEDNEYGKPANSLEWYERTSDGKFRYVCGCILSPDFYTPEGILNVLQLYLCNPVDGDFVADMEFFAPNAASNNEAFPLHFDIAHIKCSQFLGRQKGGSGFPDPDGKFPNGLAAYEADTTGNAGEGAASVVGSYGPQQVVNYYVQAEYEGQPIFRNNGSRLLIPES